VPAVAAASGSVSASASASASATLIVDVAGAVRKPGVFEFAPGDRVIDAVQRAGGALDKADLTLLNLAAPLTDGQQILVP
jgi:competence protein ComEA